MEFIFDISPYEHELFQLGFSRALDPDGNCKVARYLKIIQECLVEIKDGTFIFVDGMRMPYTLKSNNKKGMQKSIGTAVRAFKAYSNRLEEHRRTEELAGEMFERQFKFFI